jgi:hypothetical protein
MLPAMLTNRQPPMADSLEQLTNEQVKLKRAIALREDLLKDLGKKRDGLMLKIAAGRDADLDDELIDIGTKMAGLHQVLDGLRRRDDELAVRLDQAQRRERRRATVEARQRIAIRAGKQVALARAVDEAGKALLEALSAYCVSADTLAADAVPVLKASGLWDDRQANVVLSALRADGATEPAVMLVREITRCAPGSGLDGQVLTNNAIPDGAPDYESAAIKAAEMVQMRLVTMLAAEAGDA